MSNYKVVLDASHGGTDIGNTGNNIVEKDSTLKISKYISERLNNLGIQNTLTRDSDINLTDEERVNKIKNTYGTGSDVIVISNHLNSGDSSGAEIVYALRNSDALSSLIASNLAREGEMVSKYYQRRLPSNVSKDYYYIIRETPNNQSLIVYYGYVDNEKEAAKIKNDYESLGEAIVKSLATYTNTPYKHPIGENTYTVVKGDNLYSIARRFNTTVDNIKRLNNLTSNLLNIGDVLKIPTSEENNDVTYKVVKGDSLYSIANRYNTTVDKLKALNNLKSNLINIGDILKIPTSENNNFITYKVVKGDSLYSIAKRYNTTVDKIKILNNLTSNLLNIGDILKIPND